MANANGHFKIFDINKCKWCFKIFDIDIDVVVDIVDSTVSG